jgi:prevent-host-death family protein
MVKDKMREIQASKARTHLLRLLDDVERGETLIITRHGRAIARIVPEVKRRQEEIDSAIEGIMALRQRNGKITFEELRTAREEGRCGGGHLFRYARMTSRPVAGSASNSAIRMA